MRTTKRIKQGGEPKSLLSFDADDEIHPDDVLKNGNLSFGAFETPVTPPEGQKKRKSILDGYAPVKALILALKINLIPCPETTYKEIQWVRDKGLPETS